jgi:hypothetical protein
LGKFIKVAGSKAKVEIHPGVGDHIESATIRAAAAVLIRKSQSILDGWIWCEECGGFHCEEGVYNFATDGNTDARSKDAAVKEKASKAPAGVMFNRGT